MNNWMLLRTKPGIVTACALVALAVVTLSLANKALAIGYPVGSEEALDASLFDPFSLTTTSPFRSTTIRSVAPSRSTVATAVPTVSEATYVAPIYIPRVALVRSPSRIPQVRTPSRMR